MLWKSEYLNNIVVGGASLFIVEMSVVIGSTILCYSTSVADIIHSSKCCLIFHKEISKPELLSLLYPGGVHGGLTCEVFDAKSLISSTLQVRPTSPLTPRSLAI